MFPDRRDGTEHGPAGGRGGERAAPFPSFALQLPATFSFYLPQLLPSPEPAAYPKEVWPGLLPSPGKDCVSLGQSRWTMPLLNSSFSFLLLLHHPVAPAPVEVVQLPQCAPGCGHQGWPRSRHQTLACIITLLAFIRFVSAVRFKMCPQNPCLI